LGKRSLISEEEAIFEALGTWVVGGLEKLKQKEKEDEERKKLEEAARQEESKESADQSQSSSDDPPTNEQNGKEKASQKGAGANEGEKEETLNDSLQEPLKEYSTDVDVTDLGDLSDSELFPSDDEEKEKDEDEKDEEGLTDDDEDSESQDDEKSKRKFPMIGTFGQAFLVAVFCHNKFLTMQAR